MLGHLAPAVSSQRPDLVAPLEPTAGPELRTELFGAVVDLVGALGEDRPVVLVLDDLHWGHGPTLQLLTHLVTHSPRHRLLVLGTYRTTAPDRSDLLGRAVAELHRRDGVQRIDLPGLSADEIVEYLTVEGGVGTQRARRLASLLRDTTGGNPFLLREAWRDLQRRGGDPSGLRERAPASVRETFEARLAHLDARSRGVLECAAVLGDGGDLTVLAAASQVDGDGMLAAADAAAAHGFLDPVALAVGRVAFPHMLVRQSVLDLLPFSRRATLHARLGEVLEQRGGEKPGTTRLLAHHFGQAHALGYGDRAARYAEAAGGDAERALAFEDAAGWYERAAELLVNDPDARDRLWFAAASCHLRGGDFASAREQYRRLVDATTGTARLAAAVGFEDANWRPGLPGQDACRLLTEALAGVAADLYDPQYVTARASLGRALMFVGDPTRSRLVAQDALTQARALGRPDVLRHALAAMMWQAVPPLGVSERRQQAAELCRLGSAASDWVAVGTGAVFGAVMAYLRSDLAAWQDAVGDLDAAERMSGQPFLAYMRRCSAYAHAFLAGDFTAASRVAEDLLERGQLFGPDDTEGPYGLQMFMLQRETGDLEAVRPVLAHGLPEPAWEPGLLAVLTELGELERARPLLDRLLPGVCASAGAGSPWSQATAVLVFVTEAALALQDHAAAVRLRPVLEQYAGQQLVAGQFVAVFGPADAYLGALAALVGDDEAADAHFKAALEQAAALGSVVHRAQTSAMWSLALAQRVDGAERAAQLAGQARRLADSIQQRRVARLLARTTAPVRVVLTPRERQVLELVAEGRSNRQVARALGISENTAANHVRSVLLKTGSGNRTELTRRALAGGWLSD
jgi:DNA-binding CsgD family transcriptional regulator